MEQKDEWNEIVKSFKNWDIYYLNEYAHSFFIHGDGMPYLVYLSNRGRRMAYVVMQNDISAFPPFNGKIDEGTYYDWSTPYGYGGPLYEGDIEEAWIEAAEKEIEEYAREHCIVSEFCRYNPLLQNQRLMEAVCNVIYLKKTVYIDTSDMEVIWANMSPNARNMARKAEKSGIEIISDYGNHLDEFIDIYNETMKYNEASEYYYFRHSYFEDIIENMKGNIIFFHAVYEKRIVSSSVFLFNDNYMHYHLSGTLPEYRKFAPANLILTKAAYWACEKGIRQLHLGGGVENEDGLFRFKKHFNRNGLRDFCIGSKIFMPEEFNKLVEIRKKKDKNFDEKKNFLILYRG